MKNIFKKIVFQFVLVLFLSTLSYEAMAQCAMCRATVESNMSEGDNTVVAGLNKGILFLLAAPYTAFAVIAYLWYKNSRKEHEKRFKASGYSRGQMSSL